MTLCAWRPRLEQVGAGLDRYPGRIYAIPFTQSASNQREWLRGVGPSLGLKGLSSHDPASMLQVDARFCLVLSCFVRAAPPPPPRRLSSKLLSCTRAHTDGKYGAARGDPCVGALVRPRTTDGGNKDGAAHH